MTRKQLYDLLTEIQDGSIRTTEQLNGDPTGGWIHEDLPSEQPNEGLWIKVKDDCPILKYPDTDRPGYTSGVQTEIFYQVVKAGWAFEWLDQNRLIVKPQDESKIKPQLHISKINKPGSLDIKRRGTILPSARKIK